VTVHDTARILGQNSETICFYMSKDRIKSRKEGVVYIILTKNRATINVHFKIIITKQKSLII